MNTAVRRSRIALESAWRSRVLASRALLCDRVLIMSDGVVQQELTADITPDSIVGSIYTAGTRARLRQRTAAVPVVGPEGTSA